MKKLDSAKNILIVTGTFNEDGGSISYFGQMVYNAFSRIFSSNVTFLNGGGLDCLATCFSDFSMYQVIFWMPHIEGPTEDYLSSIKKKNKTIILIQAQRNDNNCYTTFQILDKMFKVHANICLEISHLKKHEYSFRVLDPLGNLWYSGFDIGQASYRIANYVKYLLSLTRLPSNNVLDIMERVTIEKPFIDAVKFYGWRFSELIQGAINKERYVGNASTRCMAGFPSMKDRNNIYVSMRNIDKRSIEEEHFVPVALNGNEVQYYGENKPSVDTPIQVMLYNYYHNVKYIIHGHTYVPNAPYTSNFVPCGYLEEVDEVTELFRDHLSYNFAVNLIGHGFLILAHDVSYFAELGMKTREFPEHFENAIIRS
jgi:hypothetical protein